MQILSAGFVTNSMRITSDIELEQAKAFVEKKHIDIENADYKELQKVKAALYRRGFSMDIINKTLDSKGLFLDIIDN